MKQGLAVRIRTGLAVWALLAWGGVQAAGGGGSETRNDGSPAELAQGVALIQSEKFSDAVLVLEPYVRRARNDADGHNWLAYAYRKSGRLPLAFEHYKRALNLLPTHRGAHEYIGEAYLDAGQPENAEFHLRELARICNASCEQYEDLKAAIAAYRAGKRPPAAQR
jgi:tetratricopeptide (TPR) repeat protein